MTSPYVHKLAILMTGVSLLLAACADNGIDATPVIPVSSMTCDEIVERWRALIAAPAMVSCGSDEDCASAGGLAGCTCGYGIAGCGVGVNAAAFHSSDGSALAARYAKACPDGFVCDCGDITRRCISGVCRSSASGCTLGGRPVGS